MWMDSEETVLAVWEERCVNDDFLISNLLYWMEKGQRVPKVEFDLGQIVGEMTFRGSSGCTEEAIESESELELMSI